MTQGVLLFCFNTDTCEYHKIAERCVKLIQKNLKLEITIVTNFETYKKQIQQIVLVEDNKSIHKIDTSPEDECNVKAKRTAWNSNQKYQILDNLCEDIAMYIQKFIDNQGYDIPEIITQN